MTVSEPPGWSVAPATTNYSYTVQVSALAHEMASSLLECVAALFFVVNNYQRFPVLRQSWRDGKLDVSLWPLTRNAPQQKASCTPGTQSFWLQRYEISSDDAAGGRCTDRFSVVIGTKATATHLCGWNGPDSWLDGPRRPGSTGVALAKQRDSNARSARGRLLHSIHCG